MVFVPTSQDVVGHMRKTLIRRELSWCGIPQKSFPGFPLTNPAPHIEMRGDILRPVFAYHSIGLGVKGNGVGQRMREER